MGQIFAANQSLVSTDPVVTVYPGIEQITFRGTAAILPTPAIAWDLVTEAGTNFTMPLDASRNIYLMYMSMAIPAGLVSSVNGDRLRISASASSEDGMLVLGAGSASNTFAAASFSNPAVGSSAAIGPINSLSLNWSPRLFLTAAAGSGAPGGTLSSGTARLLRVAWELIFWRRSNPITLADITLAPAQLRQDMGL